MTTFYKNYIRLCAQHNVSPSAAAEAVGLSRTSPNGWKKGKTPSETNMRKLADYFAVDVSELVKDEMTTVDRVKLILAKREIPVSYMEAKLDFDVGYIDSLDGDVPDDSLALIADYLSTTPAFLRGYKNKPVTDGDELDNTTKELIDIAMSISDADRQLLLEMAKSIRKAKGY